MKTTLTFLAIILALSNGNSLKDFTTGNYLFSAQIYKEQIKAGGNTLVSPLSADLLLALTQYGAKGETGEEIGTALHLPKSVEETQETIVSYLASVKPRRPDRFYSLHLANKIYIKKDILLNDTFKYDVADIYIGEVENIDFSQKSKAIQTINKWVETRTEKKIHNLIEAKNLDNATMVLVNALYFKGRWQQQFNYRSIRKADFYKSANDVIQVDTMFQKGKFHNFLDNKNLKAKFLEIAIKGVDAQLVVVVPYEKEGLASLEEKAEEVILKHRLQRKSVNIALPKFKIESKVDLKQILKKLGVSKLFSNQADLSGIAGAKGNLSVSEIIQKVFIDVNETGVKVPREMAVVQNFPDGPVRNDAEEFIADHPFMFYLMARKVVLFAGRVLDPSQ